ncbi:MAG: aminotransferase class I/II-fold pyridoxal phosphate-dependent enzyme, partial [Pseudomonadota bacterium]
HLNALVNAAGHAALDDKEHLDNTLAMVKEGKEYLTNAFDRLGIYYWPSHTNFIMFKPAMPADELIEAVLKRGIMVRPTHRNGFPGGVRVTVGLPKENRAFVEALEAVLA